MATRTDTIMAPPARGTLATDRSVTERHDATRAAVSGRDVDEMHVTFRVRQPVEMEQTSS